MRRVTAVVALIVTATVGAARAAPPATLYDVATWAEARLTGAGDWPVLGFNSLAVTFGSPTGATLWDDGLVEGDVRQEFFEPIERDGYILRSTMGRWTVDCAHQRYAILRLTLYARNDLKAQLAEQETEPPVWFARDRISEHAIDGMCQAAGKAPRPAPPR